MTEQTLSDKIKVCGSGCFSKKDVKEAVLEDTQSIEDLRNQLRIDFLAHKNIRQEMVMGFINARITNLQEKRKDTIFGEELI